MNRWKDELDGIAGDYSDAKVRLASGIDAKLEKKSKKKAIRFSTIVALIVSIIGIFIYNWSTEPSFSKSYSSDSPVYFDEKMYKFYQAILYEIKDQQERENEAFRYLVSAMAQEHAAYEHGYVFDQQVYKKALQEITERYLNDDIEDEYLTAAAKLLNMSNERFIKKIVAPVEAKLTVMYDATANFDNHLLYTEGIAKYEKDYEQEIHALAEKLGVEYSKIITHYNYTGRIVAVEEGSKGSILVVDGATVKDVESMSAIDIVKMYGTGIWFNIQQLGWIPTVNNGDIVSMSYESLDKSLPGYADAIDMYVVEQAEMNIVYYDESLFNYFTLHFAHIKDEALRHELAFELYVEWLAMGQLASNMNYELNSIQYGQVKSEVIKEFETSMGSPPFKEEDITELAKVKGLSNERALYDLLTEVEIHQRLVHEWNNGEVIVPYDHMQLKYFKLKYEDEIESLANRFGIKNYNGENSIPFYIGRVIAIENGIMDVITGTTSTSLLSLDEQQIEQMKETALSFEYYSVPRLSVGDIVKVHYNEFQINAPMKPIKITIISDKR